MQAELLWIWIGRRFQLTLEFKLADFWIGAFAKMKRCSDASYEEKWNELDVWLCLIPCLPLHFYWELPCTTTTRSNASLINDIKAWCGATATKLLARCFSA